MGNIKQEIRFDCLCCWDNCYQYCHLCLSVRSFSAYPWLSSFPFWSTYGDGSTNPPSGKDGRRKLPNSSALQEWSSSTMSWVFAEFYCSPRGEIINDIVSICRIRFDKKCPYYFIVFARFSSFLQSSWITRRVFAEFASSHKLKFSNGAVYLPNSCYLVKLMHYIFA